MIQPKYVTSEQAKKLKIKGFNEKCEWLYNEQGEPSGTKMGMGGYPNNYNGFYARPEHWMVVEWLLERYGIWISVNFNNRIKTFNYFIDIPTKDKEDYDEIMSKENYNSPQQAYEAAFDYILNNII
jgi:hypothetical protein